MSKYLFKSALFVLFAIAVVSSCGNDDNTCEKDVQALKFENDGLKAQIDSLNEEASKRAQEAEDYAKLAAFVIVRRPPIGPPPSPCEMSLNCIPIDFKSDLIRYRIGDTELTFTQFFEKFKGQGPLKEQVEMLIPEIEFKGLDEPPMEVIVGK